MDQFNYAIFEEGVSALTLSEDGIDEEDAEREKCSCPDQNPDKMSKKKPGDKSTPFVYIPWPHASDRKPFKPNL